MTRPDDLRKISRSLRRAAAIAEGSLSIWQGRGKRVPSGKVYKRKPKHTKESE